MPIDAIYVYYELGEPEPRWVGELAGAVVRSRELMRSVVRRIEADVQSRVAPNIDRRAVEVCAHGRWLLDPRSRISGRT